MPDGDLLCSYDNGFDSDSLFMRKSLLAVVSTLTILSLLSA